MTRTASPIVLCLLLLAVSSLILDVATAKGQSRHALQQELSSNRHRRAQQGRGIRGLDEKKSKKSKEEEDAVEDIAAAEPAPVEAAMAEPEMAEPAVDEELAMIEAEIEELETKAPKSTKKSTTSDDAEGAVEEATDSTINGDFLALEDEFLFANDTTIGIAEGDLDERADEDAVNSTIIPSLGTYIKLTGDETSCVSYNTTLDVVDCDAAGDSALWEVVESADPTLFQLRHIESDLCIPENPESVDEAFNCWIDEANQAIADTINDLVNCTSPFAAFVGFVDPADPSLLYNAICSTGEVGADSDVVLMAYTVDGTTQLLWGEKVLLDLAAGGNAPFALDGSWFLENA